jgi:hypothetical protein
MSSKGNISDSVVDCGGELELLRLDGLIPAGVGTVSIAILKE